MLTSQPPSQCLRRRWSSGTTLVAALASFVVAALFFTHTAYSQIAPLAAELREIFATRKSFADYLDRAAPVLRRFERLFPS